MPKARRIVVSGSVVVALLLAVGTAFAQEANVVDCPQPVWTPSSDGGYDMPPPCLGTEGADVMNGNDGDDVFLPNGDWINGSDYIKGLGGPDKIYGLGNNDYLFGDAGGDEIHAGAGGASVFGGSGHDALVGGSSWDRLQGENGRDRLYGRGATDMMFGGPGPDLLVGGGGGTEGNPQPFYGDEGADRIRGGEGSDIVYAAGWADEWNDRPTDGKKDTIECGAGQDTVWYKKGEDVVANDCENLHLYRLPPD